VAIASGRYCIEKKVEAELDFLAEASDRWHLPGAGPRSLRSVGRPSDMHDILTTLPVVLLSLFVSAQVIRRSEPNERPLLWLSLLMHHLFSIAHVLVMELYYGYGDIFAYARQGRAVAAFLRADFSSFAPGLAEVLLQRAPTSPLPFVMAHGSTGSMQSIASFAMFFFNDSLYAACAAIAGIAFLSKLVLYGAVKRELSDVPQRSLLICCMLVPSTVFWTCVMLKEPIAMIGICVVVNGWQRFMSGERGLLTWFSLVAGSLMIVLIKAYIFPVLGVGLAVWYFLNSFRAQRDAFVFKLWHVAVAIGLMLLVVVGTGLLMPQFALDNIEEEVSKAQVMGERVTGGSGYSLGGSSDAPSSQLALAPLALLTSLFRPLLFEATNAFILISALEMSFFVVFTCIALYRRKITGTLSETFRRPVLGFCVTFIVGFGTGVGLATTNLGTLVRYRTPLIPFFAVLLVTLLQRSRQSAEVAAPAVATRAIWASPRLPQ
jgi:hypothetical protein